MNRPAAFAFALLLALPLAAQGPTWKLPPRGAAEYARTFVAQSATANSRAGLDKVKAEAKVPDGLLPRLQPAAWLCQGELDAEQRAVGDPPRDLRDVLRAVAFDLRLEKTVKRRYARVVPFGDLVLSGKLPPLAAAGTQTFGLDLTTEDPVVVPGEPKADVAKFIRPLCKYAATGKVEVTRVFDADEGVVRSCEAKLTLVFEEKKDTWRRLELADTWRLVTVHDNQDAAFRARVVKGIQDGAAWIKKDLDGLTKRHYRDQDDHARSYGAGRIALALLTLLHAEVPKTDPVVVAAFDELRRREFVDTYSLGVALMALAESYTPPGEADLLRSGVLKAPVPRVLSAADKQLAAEWLQQLQQNIDTRGDKGYRMRFNYVPGPRFDVSVNQYGVLGLFAAELCQLEVPISVWRAVANGLLEVQHDHAGRELELVLTSYRELAGSRVADAGKRTRGAPTKVPTRGFSYQITDRPAYGSMTAAGVGSLVIARSGLVRAGLDRADLMPKLDAATAAGFAWLGAEFSVRSNPGYVDRADDHWYYYLYGLERTCELAGVALLHGRDWYYEGALQLLAQQQKNGGFRPEYERGLVLDATCFAVLFLKKAALPAATGD
ncbi:MAG: hypothetical protein K8J09_02355 [Planctomycetes bacterium]|nr:hypothetical protein [Planctomycetota bacterium]